jgi:peptidoglycan/LPS O-acetylase OafA/YrhL
MRLLLAFSVIMLHTGAPYTFAGGRIAVEMFFMISGFLISYVVNKDAAYSNPIKFYIARVLRIYPTYYVIAAAMLILFVGEHNRISDFERLPLDLRWLMGVVNVTIIGQDWTNFIRTPAGMLPLHKFLFDPPAWTLGVELSFYLIAPFIVRRRPALIALLAASLGLRLIGWFMGLSDNPWAGRFFPFELVFFVAGALSQQLVLPWAGGDRRKWLVVPVTVAALVLVASAMSLPPIEPARTALVGTCFFMALPFIFIFQRQRRWDVAIGDLSYPIYLVHWPVAMVVLELLRRSGLWRASSYPPMLPFIVTVLALIAAVVLEAVVGRPVNRLRAELKADHPALRVRMPLSRRPPCP